MFLLIVFFVLSETQEITLFVDIFQDYGLDVNAFRTLVDDCPQRLLDLSANCCNVGALNLSKIVFKTYENTVWCKTKVRTLLSKFSFNFTCSEKAIFLALLSLVDAVGPYALCLVCLWRGRF